MTYEEALAHFAAAKFGIPRNSIEYVDLDMDYESGCPTCGAGVSIVLHARTDLRSYGADFFDIGEVVRGVVEAGELASQAEAIERARKP